MIQETKTDKKQIVQRSYGRDWSFRYKITQDKEMLKILIVIILKFNENIHILRKRLCHDKKISRILIELHALYCI